MFLAISRGSEFRTPEFLSIALMLSYVVYHFDVIFLADTRRSEFRTPELSSITLMSRILEYFSKMTLKFFLPLAHYNSYFVRIVEITPQKTRILHVSFSHSSRFVKKTWPMYLVSPKINKNSVLCGKCRIWKN